MKIGDIFGSSTTVKPLRARDEHTKVYAGFSFRKGKHRVESLVYIVTEILRDEVH